MRAQMAEIKFQSNQEKKEDETELRKDLEDLIHGIGKDPGGRGRREPAKQRRSQGQSRGNFPHHGRLAKASEQIRKNTGRDHDHTKLHQDAQRQGFARCRVGNSQKHRNLVDHV
jgi:hypothetical protein